MEQSIYLKCKCTFNYYKSVSSGKYCSYKCYWLSKKGVYPKQTGQKKVPHNSCQDCKQTLIHRCKKTIRCLDCYKKYVKVNHICYRKTGMSGSNHPRFGKKLSASHRKKISLSKVGKMRGEKHPRWKGGRNYIYSKNIRNSANFANWREKVFIKNDYTCQLCFNKGGELHSHHIFSFTDYPNMRFQVNNGVTVHKDCHYLIHNNQTLLAEEDWYIRRGVG